MADLQHLLTDLKRQLTELYGDRLRGLYLFGSHARGEAREDSDIDVLMVLDEYESAFTEIERTGRIAGDLSLEHDCVISLIPMRQVAWVEQQTPFAFNVRQEGVPV
jgi:predicted nucleotidyltransferase